MSLAPEIVLDLWERASDCSSAERVLAILGAACPEFEPMHRTIGECEARLLALHESLFGRRLDGFAACPRCGEALEIDIDIVDLRASVGAASPVATLQYAGYTVEFRALTGADLADAAACATVDEAHAVLVRRAVVSCARRGRNTAATRLPRRVAERLALHLATADPWAESLLNLMCPECGQEWQVLLDVGAFLWTKIRASALRLLRQVHTLAAAYGWREADVFALSPRRREAYLDLVGA